MVLPQRGWTDRPTEARRSNRERYGRFQLSTSTYPPKKVVHMPRGQIVGTVPVTLARWVPACGALRHLRRCRLRRSSHPSSTFLRSLRSRPITALRRYYGRSDSCPYGSSAFRRHELRLLHEQVSLIHALGLPTIPSPSTGNNNKRSASPSRGTLPHQRVRPRLHLQRVLLPTRSRGFTFATQARHTAGRIEFSFLSYGRDLLRTSRSPPAALHLVSRRRSCSRLRVTLTWRGLSPLRPNALSGAGSGRPCACPGDHKIPVYITE